MFRLLRLGPQKAFEKGGKRPRDGGLGLWFSQNLQGRLVSFEGANFEGFFFFLVFWGPSCAGVLFSSSIRTMGGRGSKEVLDQEGVVVGRRAFFSLKV